MSDSASLPELLLKQEALAPGTASTLVLEQIRRQQEKDEARERFWFRMACGFWITAGICVVIAAILSGAEMHVSASSVAVAQPPAAVGPAPVGNAGEIAHPRHETKSGMSFHPIRSTFMAAITLLPIAIFGGLFCSAWLMLTRRGASRANLQLTLAALSSEIRELARKQTGGEK
jgi:hypothetical protein